MKISQVFYVCLTAVECEVILLWNACTSNSYFHNKYIEPRTKLESKSNIYVNISEHIGSKVWLLWANSEWLLLIVARDRWGTVVNSRGFNYLVEEMLWSVFFYTVKYSFKIESLSRKMNMHNDTLLNLATITVTLQRYKKALSCHREHRLSEWKGRKAHL